LDSPLPPQSREAEQSAIGALFREGLTPRTVLGLLRADDFYWDVHREIFQIYVELTTAGKPFEPVTLFEGLKANGWLDDSGGAAYIAELWDAVPTAANFEYHAKIIKEKSTRRQLIHLAAEVSRDAYSPVGSAEELRARLLERAGAVTKPTREKRFQFIDHDDFMKGDFRPTWLIENVLVKGEPGVIGGPSKTLKTSIAADMVISAASGTSFLDRFSIPEPIRVAILSGESGRSTLQTLAKRVVKSKGLSHDEIAKKVKWCFNLPILSDPACVLEFVEEIVESRVSLVILDPFYLMLGSADPRNIFEVGPVLSGMSEMLLKNGVTPILVHHVQTAE
jgi:hypothetical protein